jgi:hypothetical protein
MSVNDRARMERIMAMVRERAVAERKLIHEEFEPTPLGRVLVDDENYAAWFELVVQKYPSMSWIMPDGMPIDASPWVLMLLLHKTADGVVTLDPEEGKPVVEGGLALVKRYERIRGIAA